MGGRGTSAVRNKADISSGKTAEELREDRRAILEERTAFLEKNMSEDGSIPPNKVSEFESITRRMDSVEFELFKQLSPIVKEDKWNKSGLTALDRDEATAARQDILKNRDFYMAIREAEHGVGYVEGGRTLDTAIDTMYKANPDKVYNVFSNTRKALQQKHGDTITLYRAGTEQTNKTTQNMTTTRANAEQYAKIYGSKVTSVKVPVKDILAVNISRTGGYEEVIVLNKKRKK